MCIQTSTASQRFAQALFVRPFLETYKNISQGELTFAVLYLYFGASFLVFILMYLSFRRRFH